MKSSLNNYFDKIYCLSLVSQIERRETMNRLKKKFNIEFEFFNAIPGNLMYNIWEKLKPSHFYNSNYVACALSHLSIYQNALDRGFNRILIIEDDILIRFDVEEYFNNIINQLQSIPDWDLLYLAWIPLNEDQSLWTYGNIDSNLKTQNIFKAKGLWSGMGYGINNITMKYLITKYKNNFNWEIDRTLALHIQESDNFNCYGITPQLFCGTDNFSNNSEKQETDIFIKSHDPRYSNDSDYI